MTSPWFERDPAAFAELERTLRARYPTLHAFIEDGRCELRGTLAPVDVDRYQLRIALPDTYPRSLPSIFETGGRIPQTIERHVFPGGALCLGVPLALWIALRGDFRIGNVIEGPLRSYLIGNSLVEQGEPWPHGDRSHGAAGILEHFGEFIGTAEMRLQSQASSSTCCKEKFADIGCVHAAAATLSASAIGKRWRSCDPRRRPSSCTRSTRS